MKIINGLREEDFMTFRWNADVHTVRRRTGEYRILNNRGICLGEMTEEYGLYKITLYEETSENNNIEKVAEQIINKELEEPKVENCLTHPTQNQKIIPITYSKRVTKGYPKIYEDYLHYLIAA